MKSFLGMSACLLLGAGLVAADVSLPPAVSNSIPPANRLDLDLTCVLPADGPAVAQGLLVVRLYEYDPRKADGAANMIAEVSLAGIVHEPGTETAVRFPCRGTTAQRKSYFVTAVVYPKAYSAVASAGLYRLDGFQRVLADGDRQALSVTLVPVESGMDATN